MLRRLDDEHAAVAPLGGRRALKEEIYLHRNFDPATVRVLEVLDMEATEKKQPRYVPVVWCKQVGKGRVLYTSLGHRPDVWSADWYQQHLANSIKWLRGELPGSAEPNPKVSEHEETLAKGRVSTRLCRGTAPAASRVKSPREPERVPETAQRRQRRRRSIVAAAAFPSRKRRR